MRPDHVTSVDVTKHVLISANLAKHEGVRGGNLPKETALERFIRFAWEERFKFRREA